MLMDEELIQLVLRVGLAVGSLHKNTVVAYDTRTSSSAVKHAVISGLLTTGSKCYDAGLLPTPTLALATREFDAGIMVTASHNPPEYNGIKLLTPDGSGFDSNQRNQIEEMVLGGSLSVAPWHDIQPNGTYGKAIEQHIERVERDFHSQLKVKVVLDCGCGAGTMITPYLLKRLGCDVITMNCYPSGFFPRGIEPIADNLGDLIKATKELGADLGIAHDGDADRMMVVDDKGRFVLGDKLVTVFAQALGVEEVVTTIDASMTLEEMGYVVTRTKVGDTYVSEQLKKGGDLGGETSGSWVFPKVSLCPDGIYAAALIASVASKEKLSRLVESIPSYPLLRGSISCEGVTMSELREGLIATKPLSVSNVDGIRLTFEDGWLLIRSSGTEPRIRVTAEARSEAMVRNLYDSGIRAIQQCIDAKKGR